MVSRSPFGVFPACYPAAIGLGGNLGPVLQTLEGAIAVLDSTPGIRVRRCSRWYGSRPLGPPQPNFVNGCALLEVALSPQGLLHTLLAVEQRFGRLRKERWGPRTLDLDLIFYGDRQLDSDFLQLPHPQFHLRSFVLVPLADIAADWIDPRSGATVKTLLQGINPEEVWPLIPQETYPPVEAVLC